MPLKSLLCLLLFLSPAYLVWAKTYVWTDLNGQKIEAEFVRADESTVTIFMEGQELDLPLDSLSAFSKALAIKLRKEASSGQTTPQPVQKISKPLYDWKDLQGRVIRAEFVNATATAVQVSWNGQPFVLPMANLSEESKQLARRLSPPPPPPAPVVAEKTQPTPAPPSPQMEPTDPDGPLDLDAVQVWMSDDGRPLRAKFIDFDGEQLELLVGQDRSINLGISDLDKNSVKLAEKLGELNDQRKKKLEAFAKQRLKMKVPGVTAGDLQKTHSFENTEGNTISAIFIDADNDGAILQLTGRSTPVELPWNKFSSSSQALIEALRRKAKQLKPAVTSVPAKGSKLGYFANGPFKGYNTVIQTEKFDAALSSSGASVKIWLKNSKAPSQTPKTFSVGFGTRYTDTSNPEKHRRRSRNITGFENPPEPSMKRDHTTVTGTFNNGGKFQYDIEVNDKGLLIWSKMTDPSGEKQPTSIRIGVSVPGIVPNSKNATMPQIQSIVGDASFYIDPVSGSRRQYPFDEKWAITNTKYKGKAFNGMKAFTVMGSPYGNKISFMPAGSGMSFSRDVAYGKTFPFQGLSLQYANGSSPRSIPKNKALKVIITGQ